MVTTSEPPQPQRRSETRRSNKPIMEKRRRARINNCLNELKSLILDAMKKDPARHSKLEKADILEMTVKHVETMQRHQVALAAAADPAVVNKFKAGWGECLTEVGRFPGLEQGVKKRLLEHLSQCMDTRTESASEQGSHVVALVPTRLPNGHIALVLPSSPPPLAPATPNQPVSLVVRKPQIVEKPWRPW
ncbi:protein hairy [Cimex lectularius]|uniref:Hairy n=1 Tax=Cimex lectularius TaxID=79782 RepID=A0A8I6RAB2_CIMLE|nr:protein hairy [Cimex lectularius]